MENNVLPLEGIRIVDFTWVFAGPYATMLLGSLGAEVIKIEGHIRTDLTRHGVLWRLPDPAPVLIPPNQAMSFNTLNMNKKSVTLDMSRPEGRDLAKRLISMSDVVVDNFRAGAMQRMGLDYEELRRLKPDIIAFSSSSRGQEGPQWDYGGYASIHHAIGGGAYTTGYPDGEPSTSNSDVDLMNATAAAFTILAALHHRERTGEGQFIDYSQAEGVSSLIGEQFLGYQMTGEVPERMGNAHPVYAPHSVYRCWGVDRWLALEIHSDHEFSALTRVIGQPDLARNPQFATMRARKQYETELDKIISSWTRQRDRDWLVQELCNAGLAAAPSRDARDIYADPHLAARHAFVTVNHPELGPLELPGVPWKMSGHEPVLKCAPLLGEHNAYVLRELLGLSETEMTTLHEKGIIM